MTEYIEREDLLDKLHTLCKINCTHYPTEQDMYCGMCELGDVIKLIKGCPSADVIPAPTTTFISGLIIEEVDDDER